MTPCNTALATCGSPLPGIRARVSALAKVTGPAAVSDRTAVFDRSVHEGLAISGQPARVPGPNHGACSSVVEHWIVVPVVAGSNPVTHPNLPRAASEGLTLYRCHAPVAQLDRASDFGSECRGFESLRACRVC